MSNQELDNLFKSKLEKLEKQPSANAWNKIQAGQRKKAVWPWLRIAAAILLLFTIGAITWSFMNDPIRPAQLAGKEVAPAVERKQAPTITNDVGMEKSEPAVAAVERKVEPTTIPDKDATKRNRIAEQDKSSGSDKNKEISDVEKPSHTELIESIDVKNEVARLPDATITNEPASDKQAVEDKGKTLEFNIEDFANARVADNTNSKQTEEVAENKKGIDKVLNLVRETGIGDLREAKNEILAFNFKKENDDSE